MLLLWLSIRFSYTEEEMKHFELKLNVKIFLETSVALSLTYCLYYFLITVNFQTI